MKPKERQKKLLQGNIPYVKHRDENGVITNPIPGGYVSTEPNRIERREYKNQTRFMNNRKGHHLTLTGKYKYKRVRQIEKDEEGNRKEILHYITH